MLLLEVVASNELAPMQVHQCVRVRACRRYLNLATGGGGLTDFRA